MASARPLYPCQSPWLLTSQYRGLREGSSHTPTVHLPCRGALTKPQPDLARLSRLTPAEPHGRPRHASVPIRAQGPQPATVPRKTPPAYVERRLETGHSKPATAVCPHWPHNFLHHYSPVRITTARGRPSVDRFPAGYSAHFSSGRAPWFSSTRRGVTTLRQPRSEPS